MAQNELKKIQVRINAPELSVLHDVGTRWNSTLQMMMRIRDLTEPLCLYASSTKKFKSLTSEENDLLAKCISLLKPFEDTTSKLSCTSSSISDVIPVITTLRAMVSSHEGSEIMKMKETLLEGIRKRFDLVENNDLYVTATLLDPRYKTKLFTHQTVIGKIVTSIGEKCEDIKNSKISQSTSKTDVTLPKKNKPSTSTDITLSEAMNNILSSSSDDEEQCVSQDIIKNIQMYLDEKRIRMEDNPLEWWKTNIHKYPYIAELARSYLACPPSSVASERLFSGAGLIYDEKRTRLSAKRAEKLLFLKYNLPIIQFKY